MSFKFILLSTFALILSACAAPSPATPTQPVETILPTSETLPPPEPTQPPAQGEPSPTTENMPATTTYTDDFAGFSLDYPAGWFVESSALVHAEESIAYNISVASWDILHPPEPTSKDPNTLPSGGTKIDVGLLKQSMTLEEAVTQLNESSGPILARKDITLPSGLPGIILDFEGFAGLARTLVVNLNGNMIYITGYGNLEPFEGIALSLRAK